MNCTGWERGQKWIFKFGFQQQILVLLMVATSAQSQVVLLKFCLFFFLCINRYPDEIQSYAGKVVGELEIRLPENLRVLYMVPFSTAEAALDVEAVKVLNDSCYDWIQSVEKVLLDIQSSSAEGELKLVLNLVFSLNNFHFFSC